MEADARVCLACDRAYHRACVAKECPRCRGTLLAAKKAIAEHRAAESAAWEAEVQRGRALFAVFAAVQVLASVLATVARFEATCDLAALAGGGVRLVLTLCGIALISRGSAAVAWLAIVLTALGGIGGLVLAAGARDALAMTVLGAGGLAFLAMALRLATSAPFWTYVRHQRRA